MSADLELEAREESKSFAKRTFESGIAVDMGQIGASERGFYFGFKAAATLREKEIEELRALLREACGILNDAIKTDETFWLEEMRGTNEDLTERIMLMLPPTPVPETKP